MTDEDSETLGPTKSVQVKLSKKLRIGLLLQQKWKKSPNKKKYHSQLVAECFGKVSMVYKPKNKQIIKQKSMKNFENTEVLMRAWWWSRGGTALSLID